MDSMERWGRAVGIAGLMAVTATPVLAQDVAVDVATVQANLDALASQTKFVFDTLLFLIGGFLVMWMAAGFAMLEAGLVRKKSVGVQCLKNVTLFAVAGVMFWLVGYNLMYTGVDGGFFGTLAVWSAGDDPLGGAYAPASDWFFQVVFVGTAASIVSGTLAERVKVVPFLLFTAAITGFIYPIAGSWEWGKGWLDGMGFYDFAGSTLVHSVGGWAALAGVLLLGARKGRFTPDGKSVPMPGSSLPLATLGTFILWLGWFGFNGASQLALGTLEDANAVATIFMNTNLAASGGVLSAMAVCLAVYRKVDLSLVLNGAIGGLISITAGPLDPTPLIAILIGAVGGILIVVTVPMLDKLRIDDVVGAIPAHLVCGIWGTIVVPFSTADASYAVQATGIVAVGAFTFVASLVVWGLLQASMGIRIAEEDEDAGIDQIELGTDAYPEFGRTMAY